MLLVFEERHHRHLALPLGLLALLVLWATVRSVRGMLGYFSFITLATVGYGDVTPVTPLARTLAWMEAVVGQFYLGVLVAGLVGLKAAQALDREQAGPGRN